MTELAKAIKDLKETYPKITDICNNWQTFYQIHGNPQSKKEAKIFMKFADAMQVIVKHQVTDITYKKD